MRLALFVGCWALLVLGVVLIAVALGLLAGAAAVCGFLGLIVAAGAVAGIYVVQTHPLEAEVTE